jgi:hypothetical protein
MHPGRSRRATVGGIREVAPRLAKVRDFPQCVPVPKGRLRRWTTWSRSRPTRRPLLRPGDSERLTVLGDTLGRRSTRASSGLRPRAPSAARPARSLAQFRARPGRPPSNWMPPFDGKQRWSQLQMGVPIQPVLTASDRPVLRRACHQALPRVRTRNPSRRFRLAHSFASVLSSCLRRSRVSRSWRSTWSSASAASSPCTS